MASESCLNNWNKKSLANARLLYLSFFLGAKIYKYNRALIINHNKKQEFAARLHAYLSTFLRLHLL